MSKIISRLLRAFLYIALWLVGKTRGTFSTNEKQNQSCLARTLFPALDAGYLFLFQILIGSLRCLCLLWLAYHSSAGPGCTNSGKLFPADKSLSCGLSNSNKLHFIRGIKYYLLFEQPAAPGFGFATLLRSNENRFKDVTLPEEEKPCLSKYWEIYFPDREISLTLFCIIYIWFTVWFLGWFSAIFSRFLFLPFFTGLDLQSSRLKCDQLIC